MWIKLKQTPHPLGFNDNIYHEGNISRLPDFDVFSLLYPYSTQATNRANRQELIFY